MTEYKLHDFIPDYLEQDDPNIQEDLTYRKEFIDLSGLPREETPGPGKFYRHQNMLTRMLRQYDYIFNIHETGTGKTKAFINAAEYLRKNSYVDGLYIKRVYVLEPGAATIEDFTKQALDTIDDKRIKYAQDRREQIKYLNKFYDIKGYTEFANNAYDVYNEEQIEEDFSDCLFFLDEIHSLRNYDDEDKNEKFDSIYNKLWNVLHTAKRIKVVIASATPMLNGPNDFIALINLVLPKDFQIPSWDLSMIEPEKLEPFVRGKITFVKNFEKNMEEEKIGDPFKVETILHLPKKDIDIKPTTKEIVNGEIISKSASQPKTETYEKKIESEIIIKTFPVTKLQEKLYTEGFKKKEKDAFSLFENSISIFVYPIANNEYKNYDATTQYNRNVYLQNNKLAMKEELSEFFDKPDINNILYEHSPKFHFYINEELKEKGKSFCYLENVKGSGCNILGLIMEKFGFERYSSKFSSVDKFGKLNSDMSKRRRFSIITGGINNDEERSILSLFNSFDNIDGEYLQCIIASKTGRDGINLNNTIRGYIMSPIWHEAGMHQAMSRFIRTTSHDLLLKRGKVFIKVYKLATVFKDDISKSIDINKYYKAEQKNVVISRFFDVLKKYAYDSILNTERNKTGLILDKKREINYTTYHSFYIDDVIRKIYRFVKIELLNRGYSLVYLIKKYFPEIDDYTYFTAILELNEKIITTNLSTQKKIMIKGNSIFLSEMILSDVKELLPSNYSDYLFYFDPVTIENISRKVSDTNSLINEMRNMTMLEVKMQLQKMKDFERQDLLEKIIIMKKEKKDKEYEELLKHLFELLNFYILHLNIEESVYELGIKILGRAQEGRGKRRDLLSTRNLDVLYQKPLKSMSNVEIELKDMIDRSLVDTPKKYNTLLHFYNAQEDVNSYASKSLYSSKNQRPLRELFDKEFETIDKYDFKDIEKTRRNLIKYFIFNRAADKKNKELFDSYAERATEKFGKDMIYGSIFFRENIMVKQLRIYRIGDESSSGQKCNSMKTDTMLSYLKKMKSKLTDGSNKDEICSETFENLKKNNLVIELF